MSFEECKYFRRSKDGFIKFCVSRKMNADEELKRFVRLESLFVRSLAIDKVTKEDGLNIDLWKTGGIKENEI